jgi:hypothetical protein
LSGATKDDYGEVLVHKWDLRFRKYATAPFCNMEAYPGSKLSG